MAWHNADKLLIKFGTEKSQPGAGGEYVNTGAEREVEFTVDLTTLPVTTTAGGGAVPDKVPLSTTVKIPKGAMPIETIVTVLEAVTETGGANLDIGFLKTDFTAYDIDDLVDAGDGFVGGEVGLKVYYSENSTTEAGDGYGVALTEPTYMCAGLDATDDTFDTGVVKITFRYLIPTAAGYTPDVV